MLSHHGQAMTARSPTTTADAKTRDWIAPMVVKVLIRLGALAAVLGLFMTFIIFLSMVTGEDICLDRKPWWGPPNDPNVYTTCSGHMYERHQAGYGWFGGPK